MKANIKQARKSGEATDEHRAQLELLEATKPVPVREPRLLLESETAENLAWTLARPDGWPSAGLLSSEAGVVFGGHAMRRDFSSPGRSRRKGAVSTVTRPRDGRAWLRFTAGCGNCWTSRFRSTPKAR